MIKDIIVNLSVTKEASFVGKYAVSVAAALEAHLTGVAFIYDPVVPISGAGYIPAEVIETQREDNETAAADAIKAFTAASDRAGISAEPLMKNASLSGAGDQFARTARSPAYSSARRSRKSVVWSRSSARPRCSSLAGR